MEPTHVGKIFLDHGFVVKAQELERFNGALWSIVSVERIQGIERAGVLFKGVAGSPRDGCWMLVDRQMSKVLSGLTDTRKEEYRKLFSLRDPNPESLREIGFANFTVIEEAA